MLLLKVYDFKIIFMLCPFGKKRVIDVNKKGNGCIFLWKHWNVLWLCIIMSIWHDICSLQLFAAKTVFVEEYDIPFIGIISL